jgi:hypothetical protein
MYLFGNTVGDSLSIPHFPSALLFMPTENTTYYYFPSASLHTPRADPMTSEFTTTTPAM